MSTLAYLVVHGASADPDEALARLKRDLALTVPEPLDVRGEGWAQVEPPGHARPRRGPEELAPWRICLGKLHRDWGSFHRAAGIASALDVVIDALEPRSVVFSLDDNRAQTELSAHWMWYRDAAAVLEELARARRNPRPDEYVTLSGVPTKAEWYAQGLEALDALDEDDVRAALDEWPCVTPLSTRPGFLVHDHFGAAHHEPIARFFHQLLARTGALTAEARFMPQLGTPTPEPPEGTRDVRRIDVEVSWPEPPSVDVLTKLLDRLSATPLEPGRHDDWEGPCEPDGYREQPRERWSEEGRYQTDREAESMARLLLEGRVRFTRPDAGGFAPVCVFPPRELRGCTLTIYYAELGTAFRTIGFPKLEWLASELVDLLGWLASDVGPREVRVVPRGPTRDGPPSMVLLPSARVDGASPLDPGTCTRQRDHVLLHSPAFDVLWTGIPASMLVE